MKIYIESLEPMRIIRKSELNAAQAKTPNYTHIEYGSNGFAVAVAVGVKSLQTFKDNFDLLVLIKAPAEVNFVSPNFLDNIAGDCYNLSRQTSLENNPSFNDSTRVEIKTVGRE